ncbi:TPA: hypothetical protein ACHBXH_005193, partial [Klebsiella pneumoniae]
GLASSDVTWGTLTDSNWKAIDATTGEFITPTYTGTTTATYVPTTPRSVRVKGGSSASGSDDYTLYLANWANLVNMARTTSTTAPVSDAAINRLKLLGFYPLSNDISKVVGVASFGDTPDNERWFTRGGSYVGPANNSGATMNTFVPIWPNSSVATYGARVCWYEA